MNTRMSVTSKGENGFPVHEDKHVILYVSLQYRSGKLRIGSK